MKKSMLAALALSSVVLLAGCNNTPVEEEVVAEEIPEIETIEPEEIEPEILPEIEEITSKNKRVIIVGGTGLYIKAALYDYQFVEGTTDYSYSELSNEEILEKIKKVLHAIFYLN